MRRAFETVAIDRLDRIGKTRPRPIPVLSGCSDLLPVIVPCRLVFISIRWPSFFIKALCPPSWAAWPVCCLVFVVVVFFLNFRLSLY